MQTIQLGWTELKLTRVGLGTWAIGGGGWQYAWGPQDDRASLRTIYRALDLGINWIDTAPAYGLGHAEEIVGKALRGISQRPILATKCGRSWNSQGQLFGALKREVVRQEIESSLRRFKAEPIDLYQIHWPDPEADIEEAWEVIGQCIREGKIRYAGVSNFNAAQIQRLQPRHPVASLQPPYSLLERGIEAETLAYCQAQRIGVVAYSPMQKGLLTGKFNRQRIQDLPPDDHRRRDPRFQEPALTANLALVEDLVQLAKQRGKTVAQLAIAWVLRRPEVTAAIVGARQPAQLDEIAGAADWKLEASDLAAIDVLLGQHLKPRPGNA